MDENRVHCFGLASITDGDCDMALRVRKLAAILGLAGVYFATGKIGLSLAFLNASASPVWPPTGIALASLLLWGVWLWPGVFLGAFLANITTQGSLLTGLGIATGNTLEVVVGSFLLLRFAGGIHAFERVAGIVRFVVLAALLSTGLSATIGVTSLCLGGLESWPRYGPVWLTWWLGDAVSALVIAPVIVLWATQWRMRLGPMQVWEAAILLGLTVTAGMFVFGETPYAFGYLTLLPCLWAVFRFGQIGATTSVFLISCIALWGTLRGGGQFVMSDANLSLVLLQVFMGTISTAMLLFGAATAEQKRAEARLQVQHAVSRLLAESPRVEEATERILRTLCRMTVWDVAAIWYADTRANEIACAGICHAPSVEVAEFEARSKEVRFRPGIGLPGRVWSSSEPTWIPDLARDPNFPRVSSAIKCGLRTGLAFPLRLGSETLGVIECFSRSCRPRDEKFLQVLATIGDQLGQFIERKRAEEQLRESQARLVQAHTKLEEHAKNLEEAVADRTAKLSETVGELETFSYSIAHDMRAPLRAMHSFAAILQEDEAKHLSPTACDYLRRISTSAKRLDALIQDVLNYSQVVRAELKLEPVDMGRLIREIVESYPNLHPPQAEIHAQGRIPEVLANTAALTQVISNLLGNAVKFVKEGVRPTVKILAETNGEYVRVWFRDNGIGIAPEIQHKLFQMFQRLHSPGDYEGTGMGLTIVRKAVERMGGKVGVESAAGQGSRFWIELRKASAEVTS